MQIVFLDILSTVALNFMCIDEMKYAIKLLLELCSHCTGGGNHKGIYLYGGNCSLTLFLLKSVGTLPVTKFSFRDLSQGGRSLIILALIHVKN